MAQWIEQQGFDFVYWNMMHEAYYFSISTLPALAKKAVVEKLQTAQVNETNRREFDLIIDFMNRGASLDGNILRMKVADLDRKRQQNFAQFEPEMAQLIDYAGTS